MSKPAELPILYALKHIPTGKLLTADVLSYDYLELRIIQSNDAPILDAARDCFDRWIADSSAQIQSYDLTNDSLELIKNSKVIKVQLIVTELDN